MKRRTRRSQVESSPEKTPKSSPEKTPQSSVHSSPEKVKKIIVEQQNSTEKLWSLFFNLVTVVSLITRLWKIHLPQEVVFDEVHFGKFASYYLTRKYFFDVHPPLGKLLLAGMGYILGYDGHYLFENIGENYIENNVPYIGLRMLPAILGALVPTVAVMTLKEMGVSMAACTLCAVMLIFDNAMITQSRLILLDSFLLIFCILAIYAYVRFYKLRYRPFTTQWYIWLAVTGVCLISTMGVKMVGLFTYVTIGMAVLYDLWNLIDYRRKIPFAIFRKQFSARASFLIVIPFALYLAFFYIHFAVANESGPGDKFMSSAFQIGLENSPLRTKSFTVPYNQNITLMHEGTSVYLHSHLDRYPRKYDDGKVGSAGQQVTGYPHMDSNNYWEIHPVDPEYYSEAKEYIYTEQEKEFGIQYVRDGDLVRLYHSSTQSYLITHDVASPLTSTNMEMTTIPFNDTSRYEETLWKLNVVDGHVTDEKLQSHRHTITLINLVHDVAVHSFKSKLPKWGFEQQEINGNKKLVDDNNNWKITSVIDHPLVVDGSEKGLDEKESTMPTGLSFLKKFGELQRKMLSHNSGLTKSHPFSSSPGSWPFVIRGISFWEKKDDLRQIYLLPNPIVWWSAILGVFVWVCLFAMDRILLRIGFDEIGPELRLWFERTGGFLFTAWLFHYAPFFLMGRQLFLHHYLPSFIFSTMLTAISVDFMFRLAFSDQKSFLNTRTSIQYWLFVIVVCFVFVSVFVYFSPLVYGTGFASSADILAKKWLSTWDLHFTKG